MDTNDLRLKLLQITDNVVVSSFNPFTLGEY